MNRTPGPARVGLPFSAYYRVRRLDRRRYSLDRVMPGDIAAVRVTDHPWPEGTQVEVRVSVFEGGGALFCGNVQVITAPETIETPYGLLVPPEVEPLPVGANLLRLVPIGLLTDEAIRAAVREAPHDPLLLADDAAWERLSEVVRSSKADTPRRGRKPSLTPELLELVAHAYRAGGRSGVRSVQRALTEDPRFRGDATRDQAAKAVARARTKGLLPPARQVKEAYRSNVDNDN